jgi:hypothetical protein
LPPVLPGREYVHFQPQMTPTRHDQIAVAGFLLYQIRKIRYFIQPFHNVMIFGIALSQKEIPYKYGNGNNYR